MQAEPVVLLAALHLQQPLPGRPGGCAAQHATALAGQHSTAQHGTAQHSTAQHVPAPKRAAHYSHVTESCCPHRCMSMSTSLAGTACYTVAGQGTAWHSIAQHTNVVHRKCSPVRSCSTVNHEAPPPSPLHEHEHVARQCRGQWRPLPLQHHSLEELPVVQRPAAAAAAALAAAAIAAAAAAAISAAAEPKWKPSGCDILRHFRLAAAHHQMTMAAVLVRAP
jgi:hypothetical protein